MTVRHATTDEIATWNTKILANPDGGNVFQGDEFAEQKKLSGWTPQRLIVDEKIAITAHEKHVLSLGKLWYIPKGPGVKSIVQLGDMLPELQAFANQNGVFTVKLEPELRRADGAVKALSELGLVQTSPIQPNASTVLIDLSPNLDAILMGLNQKGRHAIRRAERDGVTVERVETTDENCKLFYDLLAATAAESFVIRPYSYYQKFWRRYAEANLGQLFFAYFEGQLVAGAFALVFGEKSTYKDGASVRERKAYGASHLLQWHVMQWAKNNGSLMHDLCGTPPSDEISNTKHRWYGVGLFKTSFNKQVTDYIGAYDLVVKPRPYNYWVKFGERITKSLWWRRHHENWY